MVAALQILSIIINLDRILVFDQGNILEDGTHEELLQKGGYYAKTYYNQDDNIFATVRLSKSLL